MIENASSLSRRALLVGGAALGVAACGGPARGLDPLESIHQGLGTTPLPRPWKPLVVRGTAVEVAGHRYRFDAGPLPTSLEVNGTEFLFDAIKLDVRTQDELLVWQRARAISIDAAEVELLARGNAGDLIAQTRVIISYDGTCRIRVSLIPQGLITIDSILLDIPIVRSETTHYVHHLLGAETTLLSSQELAGVPQDQWGGGRLPDSGWSGDITPFVWVGNPNRGITWFSDTVIGPQRPGPAAQVQVRPVEGAMRLLVELITDPLDMPNTVHLDFGIQPTPVRPAAETRTAETPTGVNWSVNSQASSATASQRSTLDSKSDLESLRNRGITALVLPLDWSDVWGFPHLAQAEQRRAFQDLVDRAHDAGLKILPAVSAARLSNRAPGAAEILEDTGLGGEPITVSTAPPEQAYPLFHSAASAVYFEEAVRALATDFPIDGVFVDIGEPAVRPVDLNEGLPGAAGAYDLHARRDLLRRLYALFHGGLRENDEEGIVIAQSPVPWSMINCFADLSVTGFNLYQSIASRRLSGEALADRWQPDLVPFLYGDVLHRVPTLWHVPTAASQFPSIIETYARADLLNDRELFGLAAVHNTLLWPEDFSATAGTDGLERLRELRESLGFGNASWHPYWRQQDELVIEPPSTLYGFWHRGSGSILLLLLNGANTEQDILVEVSSAASDSNATLSVKDVWDNLPVHARDHLAITTLAPSQFAVLHIETS